MSSTPLPFPLTGFVLLLCMAGASAASARAEFLSIVNPSFEVTSRPLAVGEQTNGAGGAGVPVATRFPFGGGGVSWDNPVEVPGWRTLLRQAPDTSTNYAGVLHPPLLGGLPFISGQAGQNVAAVQVAQLGQSLDAILQPDTHYRLTFLGGIGRFGTAYHLAVSLIAAPDLLTLPLDGQPGVVRLAITQGLIPPESSFGTLLPWSLEYTTPPVLPPQLLGRHIGINLYGSDGLPRVVYDDFALRATPAPEPGAAWLLGLLLVERFSRRSGGGGR